MKVKNKRIKKMHEGCRHKTQWGAMSKSLKI